MAASWLDLVSQGKVRSIGASNYTGLRLKEALTASAQFKFPRYEYLQPHYNLYERTGYDQDLEPVCMREQIGVVPCFALASGFLTGKYRSEADFTKSPRGRRMGNYMNPRGLGTLKALDEVASRYAATPAQVALAWLMARPSVTAPISSAISVEQLRDITAAARLTLDREAIQALDTASKPG